MTRAGSNRWRVARWSAVSVAVVVALLLAVLATREPATTRIAHSPLVGQPAPAIAGPGIDGHTVRLTSFRGRYVVLNFFATWCTPCLREHDDLVRFRQRHATAGDAEVLAVLFDDEADDARRFFDERGGDWPVIDDPRGRIALELGVRGPPESFLIGPEGSVLAHVVGEVDERGLENLLRRAKAGPERTGEK